MNIRAIAVAIALSICASGCEGPKGEPGTVGPPGEKGEPGAADLLVLRDLLAHQVLRARKVLLALPALPRTPFELYASIVRPQRAEGSTMIRGLVAANLGQVTVLSLIKVTGLLRGPQYPATRTSFRLQLAHLRAGFSFCDDAGFRFRRSSAAVAHQPRRPPLSRSQPRNSSTACLASFSRRSASLLGLSESPPIAEM